MDEFCRLVTFGVFLLCLITGATMFIVGAVLVSLIDWLIHD